MLKFKKLFNWLKPSKPKPLTVLSLFDGLSGGRIALERADIPVDRYYSSEVDKYAIQIADKNWPQDTQYRLGDVTKVLGKNLSKIDLLIGGSPCQGFSFIGKQLNFNDPRSQLFFEFVRLLKETKPRYFILENVNMHKDHIAVISKYLGVPPIKINSNLVSGQNRVRLYWTNIPNTSLPINTNVKLSSVLESLPAYPTWIEVREKSNCVRVGGRGSPFGSKQIWDSPFKVNKVEILKQSASISTTEDYASRRYSVTECEALQGLPTEYTKGVSDTQRYRMIGNGFTTNVIAHILKGIELEKDPERKIRVMKPREPKPEKERFKL